MSTEIRPAHSPLGASSAERWMNCPGSVALIRNLKIVAQSDEPDYRTNGTAAHAALEYCLKNGTDAWEIVGYEFGDPTKVKVEVEMADAIQVFIDDVRPFIDEEGATTFIEYGISSPLHPDFYGTVDFGNISADGLTLRIRDFKYGEGIAVDVEENPQIMYYAYGLLKDFPNVEHVDLGIVQPRGHHPDGAMRVWIVSAQYIRDWADNTLLPAMHRTEMDASLDAGPWCRFCPAKLVCPMLTSLFGAACTANPKVVVNLSDASLGRSYQYTQAVKFYLKAMEEETFARLNMGREVPGTKLVPKKANRVYKPGAEEALVAEFGKEQCFEPAEFKSPAALSKLGTKVANEVNKWAYTPNNGFTVALDADKRPAVKIEAPSKKFEGALATMQENKDA